MNNSANGNMYEYGQRAAWELFAAYMEGEACACVAVVSTTPLAESAREACENSLHALGYGRHACAFLTVQPEGLDALDAGALAAALEGLDPLCMVATDAQAAALVAAAYGQPVKTNAANRVVGRDAVAFDDLAGLMESPEGKQSAWALFKALPRYGVFNRKKR